jgi:hypothetical protein
MKKGSRRPSNGLRAEYDFSSMRGGVRGKYVKRYRAGTNLVLLEPDLAQAFPNDAAVNEALRAVLKATRVISRSKRLPNNRVQRSRARTRVQGRARTSGARR